MPVSESGHAAESDRVFLVGSSSGFASPVRGREATVAALTDALAAAHPRPILLRGRPGMGKTRLAAEALAVAERHGWRTVTITPDADSVSVPLGSLTEAALRGVTPLISPADLHPVLAGTEPPYWLTRLLLDRLERAAGAADRVLVVVDDMQWLDAASTAILTVLVKELSDQPITWLFTTRTGTFSATHSRAVDLLRRAGLVLDLSPLSADAVRDMAADLAGAPPGPALALALEQTANVPLFVVELIRGLQEEGLLRSSRATVDAVGSGVPVRFGSSSRERVEHLSPEALHVAQTASLFGRRFRLSDLLHALGSTAVAAGPAIQQLIAGDFLVDEGDALAFVHDTIREAAEATLTPSVRAVMLREVARLRLDAGEPASAVAAALMESAEPGDQNSFDLIREAARQLSSTDAARAADLAEAAIAIARHVPRLAEPAAELLPYLWADGRYAAADAATTILSPYLSSESRARTLLALARRQTESSFDDAVASCDAGLALRDIERSTRAELFAVRALNCANKADVVELTRTLALARDVADPERDHLALATIDATESVYAFNSGRFADAQAFIDSAIVRAQRAGLEWARWVPEGLWLAFLASSSGDPIRALRIADDGLSHALHVHGAVAEAYWMMIRARVLYDLGQLEDAKLQAESVLMLADELSLGDFANATAGVVLFRIALRTGDAEARRRSQPIIDALAAGGGVARAGTWMKVLEAIDDGRFDDAFAASALARESLGLPIPAMTTPSDFSDDLVLVDIALRAGDEDAVAAVAKRSRTRVEMNPESVFSRAIDAGVRGRITGQVEALQEAATLLRGLDRPLVLAQVLEHCDAVNESQADAVASLEEALKIYESTGAVRDASRVLHALRARGVRRRPRRQGSAQLLSPREQQVLEHLTAGATTQQIAEALFMSPHTVVSHIRHIYAKTGVNSRPDLRRWYQTRSSRPVVG